MGSQAWADGRTRTNVAPKNIHTLFFLVVGDPRLGNALILTSICVEGEEELQEASLEAELHGHSFGGTRLPDAVGWHVFWLIEDTSQLFPAGDRCRFHSAYTTTS